MGAEASQIIASGDKWLALPTRRECQSAGLASAQASSRPRMRSQEHTKRLFMKAGKSYSSHLKLPTGHASTSFCPGLVEAWRNMPELGEVHFCFSTWQVLSWKRNRSGIPAFMDYKMTGRPQVRLGRASLGSFPVGPREKEPRKMFPQAHSVLFLWMLSLKFWDHLFRNRRIWN